VDEILGGDQAVVLAHKTPANGVVLSPLTNFGIRDRDAGTLVSLNSSVGMWRKLDRIRRSPQVAIAFHTREHGFSDRPEYVLVQGTASLTPLSDRNWLDSHRQEWERFAGEPPDLGPLWDRWLRVYRWRVGIEMAVERVVAWPDGRCEGAPEVHGASLPSEPPESQRPPAKGTAPRVNHRRAARRARRLPHTLLGWVGADGFPVVAPVDVAGAERDGMVLRAPGGLVPPGARRAGLTAHWFSRHVVGQIQRRHTGWLEADAGRVVYAPHTQRAYLIPPWRWAFHVAAGYGTRRGLREARRAGFLAE